MHEAAKQAHKDKTKQKTITKTPNLSAATSCRVHSNSLPSSSRLPSCDRARHNIDKRLNNCGAKNKWNLKFPNKRLSCEG